MTTHEFRLGRVVCGGQLVGFSGEEENGEDERSCAVSGDGRWYELEELEAATGGYWRTARRTWSAREVRESCATATWRQRNFQRWFSECFASELLLSASSVLTEGTCHFTLAILNQCIKSYHDIAPE